MKQNDFNLMEGPFLYMISGSFPLCDDLFIEYLEILQDRYNEKAERLFKKFFDFCIKFILEGFGSW